MRITQFILLPLRKMGNIQKPKSNAWSQESSDRLKKLSVNYVDAQRNLPKRDDRCGEVVERDEAAFEFLVPYE